VADPAVEAVVIASPQATHRAIAEAAFAAGKPVFCEKPLGASLGDAQAMVAAAEASGLPNMIGFNYVRTPATQFVRKLLAEGVIGTVTWFRGEHTEDFLADPEVRRANWRCLRARQRDDGRSLAAHGQLRAGADGADRGAVGADRDVHATAPAPTDPSRRQRRPRRR
jgi:predicted dehydrogenase